MYVFNLLLAKAMPKTYIPDYRQYNIKTGVRKRTVCPISKLLRTFAIVKSIPKKDIEMKNNGFTFRKRARSFKYAFNGIRLLITREHNAWIHCFAAVCVVIAGVILGLSSLEWVAVTIVIGTVLAAEAVNSAIEALADWVSPDYNEAIKRTKDLAAGAVLLLAIAAAIVGLIIFVPKIMQLL